MHHLYNARPDLSAEVILNERTDQALWVFMREEVLKSLRGILFDDEAVGVVEDMPLELWSAQNGFNDQFSVLYAKLPIPAFIKAVRQAEEPVTATAYANIASAMNAKGKEIRFITMDFIEGSRAPDVELPDLKASSITAELALENIRSLLQHSTRGPISAVDRLHTALQAHLIYLSTASGQTPDKNASLDALFSLLRKDHANPHPQSDSILRGMARILNALSPLRNDHSLAHATEVLLEEPEARLALDAGKTILRYVDARFSN